MLRFAILMDCVDLLAASYLNSDVNIPPILAGGSTAAMTQYLAVCLHLLRS